MEMTPAVLAGCIDHTLLRPDAVAGDFERLCSEAVAWGFRTVCVNSARVSLASSLLHGSGVLVCSVAGFPLGACTCKPAEAHRAAGDGASEIDMVMDIGALREGNRRKAEDDLAPVGSEVPGLVVKVIIETCLLTLEEKLLACGICESAGASYVKTSTGFSLSGATEDDVRLIRSTVGNRLGVKASGGLLSLDAAIGMIRAGADRLGLSRNVEIMAEMGSRAAGGVVQPPAVGSGSDSA
jgi:deoxyribose-phosphate aldolase